MISMQKPQHGRNFWVGNAILVVALLMVLFIGPLWEQFGLFAMILWAVVVAVWVVFITRDEGNSPNHPD